MRTTLWIFKALICLAAMIGFCSYLKAASESQPIKINICIVVANPEKYNKKIIEFDGQVGSDGIEHFAVYDKKCNDTAIEMIFPSHKNGYRGSNLLLKTIFSGHPGTIDKEIRAHFIGEFRWLPNEVPCRTILLDKVINIQTFKISKDQTGTKIPN